MSAHASPEQVHAKLGHPVIDGDGHWLEYTPVFAEKMRKAVGDKGADGFIAAQRRIPDALSLTPAERTSRGVAMEGNWGRQSTNTRDRATAMLPKMLYDRLDELGIDFGSPRLGARLSTSIATSNNACLKPIGWVQGRPVALV